MTTTPGPFITDHRAVVSTPCIKKLRPSHGKKQVRQFNKVTTQQWIDEFKPENVKLSNKLDTLVTELSKELTRIADTLAPVIQCNISLRAKNLGMIWIKNNKRERCTSWKRSGLNISLIAVGPPRRSAGLSNLTTKQTQPQWPPHKSDTGLAEEFADFFQTEIAKIRAALTNKSLNQMRPPGLLTLPQWWNTKCWRQSTVSNLSHVNWMLYLYTYSNLLCPWSSHL